MSSQKLIKKLLVLMLTMMMVIGNLGMRSTRALAEDEPVSDGEFTSEGVTWEEVDSTTIPGLKPSKPVSENGAKKIEYDKDSIVRVAIVMEGNSTIEAGYSTEAIATNPSAKAYRAQLKANQNLVAQRISEQALGGEKLDVVWNLTLAANVISANVPYIKVERIKNVQGVKDVIIEEAYEAVKPVTPANPDMAISTDMTNTTLVSSDYTGAGQLVAIVDTGLDTDHRSFDPAAFDYAISTLDKDVDLLDRRDVSAVLEELNAYEYLPAVHGSDLYLNTKVPFAFNYIDKNLEVTHDNDTQGEHGSHVSGIAAGNRFVDDGEGNYVDALEEVKTQGQAPDAQILVMKVFGAGGGAYPDDYFAAIEDAIVLGADSINLSLGSSNAGFSMIENEYYFSVFQKLLGSDLVWVNSGGNSYDWAHESIGALYADDVNFATGGSPGTYPHTFTVASVDDDGLIGMPIQAYDHNIIFSDGSSALNAPFLELGGGEYGYIAIEGYGTEEDMAALADVLQGKIAVIQRGAINFASKANNAVANGALATLIYNNAPGIAGMNMTGYIYLNPAAAISQEDGLFLIENGEQKTTEDGMTYYEGTLKVSEEPVVETYDAEYYTMSDFSSWGTTGDLNLKPEITAPGGNIWSVNGLVPGGQAYESMSGTSMAAPQISGITAVFKQYAKENGLDKKTGLSIRQLTQSLLMSTARPLIEEDSGSYYSLMKQGAGLVDTNAAVQAKSVIKITGTTNNGQAVTRDNYTESYADGKVKAMFGDDPNRGGVYTVDFEILNFSDEDVAYEFSGEMFTQDFFEDSGILFRDTWTIPLDSAVVTFAVNGEPLEASSEEAEGLDFNADGFVNKYDAVALLEYVVGSREEIALEDLADLDGDGDLDTYDAYLALDLLDASTVEAKAGETLSVTATIDLNGSMDELGAEEFNGNYVEGYLFVKEAANDEGALGAEHSIPVFGFFGNWSDASMTDKGSYLEYTYGGEDRFPYVAYADLGYDALEVETFLVKYRGDNTSYIFAGNPLSNDAVYHPERNAINTKDTVSAYRYSLIRNSGGMRFFLTDENGEVLAQMEGGTSLAAYYVASQGAWRSTSASVGLNYRPMDFNEGDRFNLNFEMAPEYYLNEEGLIDWDLVNERQIYSMPVVIDNTAPGFVGDEPVTAVFDDETGTFTSLKVAVSDNQYIAGVVLYDSEGNVLSAEFGDDEATEGENREAVFALDAEVSPYLYVEVYDYAKNSTLYKINLNSEEEFTDPDVTITVSPEAVKLFTNSGVQLTATVLPWAYNDNVTWSSSDETVATVDETGYVTAVKEGTATITAVPEADPAKSAVCEVTVATLDKVLNGVIWDEDGQIWFSQFNVNSLPNYTKLNSEPNKNQMASLAYDENGVLYGLSLDSESFVSSLYTVNEETWETTHLGDSDICYMDFCMAPYLSMLTGMDLMYGIYGPYLVPLSKSTGGHDLGVLDFTDQLNGGYFVGIAFDGIYNFPQVGYAECFYLLDNNGILYDCAMFVQDGQLYFSDLYSYGQVGNAIDTDHFQSLYCDSDGNLYWSRFSPAENDVDMIYITYDEETQTFVGNEVGSFADSVWPVGGLYESTVVNADGGDSRHHEFLSGNRTMTQDFVRLTPSGKVVKGSLNGVYKEEGEQDDENVRLNSSTVVSETKLVLSTEGNDTNALYTVEFDPALVELVSVTTYPTYNAVYDDENGTVRIGFISEEALEEGTEVAELIFHLVDPNQETEVVVTTVDENDQNPNSQQTFLFGDSKGVTEEQAYGDPTWVWAEDGSVAAATFVREDGKEEVTVKALASEGQITSEVLKEATCEEDGEAEFTATVTVDFKTVSGESEFSNTHKIAIPATGHVWGGWVLDTENSRYYRVCENDPEHIETLEVAENGTVLRVYGKNRYETSLKLADMLKEELGVEKFDAVVVASATNFADALTGSYLADKVSAPILITNEKNADTIKAYLSDNLKEGGTVYILGGSAAVADSFEEGLDGFEVKRLSGKTRYETNIEILKEAGVKDGEIIVSTGKNYADSLSASSSGKPILLVNDKLTAAQKEYLSSVSGSFVILGGTGAVSEDVEKELKEYGSVERVSGKSRFETSVAAAKRFAEDPETIVLVYSHNFPDGLCAGPLAASLKAPVVLVRTENHDAAMAYIEEEGFKTGVVVGGDSLISDESVVEMFSLSSPEDIIER